MYHFAVILSLSVLTIKTTLGSDSSGIVLGQDIKHTSGSDELITDSFSGAGSCSKNIRRSMTCTQGNKLPDDPMQSAFILLSIMSVLDKSSIKNFLRSRNYGFLNSIQTDEFEPQLKDKGWISQLKDKFYSQCTANLNKKGFSQICHLVPASILFESFWIHYANLFKKSLENIDGREIITAVHFFIENTPLIVEHSDGNSRLIAKNLIKLLWDTRHISEWRLLVESILMGLIEESGRCKLFENIPSLLQFQFNNRQHMEWLQISTEDSIQSSETETCFHEFKEIAYTLYHEFIEKSTPKTIDFENLSPKIWSWFDLCENSHVTSPTDLWAKIGDGGKFLSVAIYVAYRLWHPNQIIFLKNNLTKKEKEKLASIWKKLFSKLDVEKLSNLMYNLRSVFGECKIVLELVGVLLRRLGGHASQAFIRLNLNSVKNAVLSGFYDRKISETQCLYDEIKAVENNKDGQMHSVVQFKNQDYGSLPRWFIQAYDLSIDRPKREQYVERTDRGGSSLISYFAELIKIDAGNVWIFEISKETRHSLIGEDFGISHHQKNDLFNNQSDLSSHLLSSIPRNRTIFSKNEFKLRYDGLFRSQGFLDDLHHLPKELYTAIQEHASETEKSFSTRLINQNEWLPEI